MIQPVRDGYRWLQTGSHWLGDWSTLLLNGGKQKSAIAVLDGIRAVACLMVITYHISIVAQVWNMQRLGPLAIALLLAGNSGVTLFFVLSGFLLFLPYAKSLLFDTPWPSACLFYLRRALRILPGYYVSLFLMIYVFRPQYFHYDHLKRLVLFLTFFMDSSSRTFQRLNGPFWTLAVEWQFYLLLPLFALGMRRIVQQGPFPQRLRRLMFCLLGLVVWGVFSRYWGLVLTAHPALLVHNFPLHIAVFFLYGTGGIGIHGKFLEDFAVGMIAGLCYVITQHTSIGDTLKHKLRSASLWLWGTGILWLCVMVYWERSRIIPPVGVLATAIYNSYDTVREVGLSLGFACCVIAVVFGEVELKKLFECSWLRWIGLISYSLYMWHVPFILIFMKSFVPFHHWSHFMIYTLCWLWVCVSAVPFSFLFYLCIERPWMLISDQLRYKLEKRLA